MIIASATKDPFKKNVFRSVGIGLLITKELKKKVRFLKDPGIATMDVGVTCERCAIVDCELRQAPPSIMLKEEKDQKTTKVVADLQKKFS